MRDVWHSGTLGPIAEGVAISVRSRGLALAVVVSTLLALAAPAQATPGDLDGTYGSGGIQITDFGGNDDVGQDVAVGSDGRAVVVGTKGGGPFIGDVAVARYTANGLPETAFNGTGRRSIDFGGTDTGQAVAIQPNGKIVVAGGRIDPSLSTSSVIVARLNPNGTLDTTFSSNGKRSFKFAGATQSRAYGVAIQSDGKIVLGGIADGDFAAARLLTDGTLDTGFDGDGRQTVDIGPNDGALAVALGPSGKIVLAGFAYSDNGAISRFGVARLTTVGQPDLTFSGDGELRTGFTGGAATAQAVVVQPNGRIVVAGQVESTTTQDFALVRYTVAGALDSSFGNGGRRTTSFGQSDAATGVAIQADGRIVAAGYASGSTADFALARYGPGGNLDGSFGNGGRVVTDISGEDTGSDVAISPLDGKILVAGTTYGGATVDIAIVRYLAA